MGRDWRYILWWSQSVPLVLGGSHCILCILVLTVISVGSYFWWYSRSAADYPLISQVALGAHAAIDRAFTLQLRGEVTICAGLTACYGCTGLYCNVNCGRYIYHQSHSEHWDGFDLRMSLVPVATSFEDGSSLCTFQWNSKAHSCSSYLSSRTCYLIVRSCSCTTH